MLVIVGLIVLLVAVTAAITMLISARATHDSFAVLSDRAGGRVIPVRDRGWSNGVSGAERISARRAASATPGVASADSAVPQLNSLKRIYSRGESP
jgi:hypothetical protein